MNQPDREDALLRTLDLLSESDAARSDPKFAGNRDLLEEARVARETAIDVWLTTSPLTAAPSEILGQIMGRLPSAVPAMQVSGSKIHRRWKAAAAMGWAAAILIGCVWWLHPGTSHPHRVAESESERKDAQVAFKEPASLSHPGAATPDRMVNLREDRKLRDESARLRQALEREFQRGRTPRVKELSRPGTLAKNPEESKERLRKLLVDALRSSLEAQMGAPGDPASVVIERGWPVQKLFELEEGTIIRHRNFPEDSWQELGLLKAGDGSYYDPTSGMVWAPDPEQRGYIGRASTAKDDLEQFRAQDKKVGTDMEERQPQVITQSEPGGFLIENPEEGTAEVIIEGAPEPQEGQTHWVVWTKPDGSITEHPVTDAMISGSGSILDQTSYLGPTNSWTGAFTSNGAGGIGSGITVELQLRGIDGIVVETVLQGGN